MKRQHFAFIQLGLLASAGVVLGGAEGCEAPTNITIENHVDNASNAEANVSVESGCCDDCCEDDCCDDDCTDTGDPVDPVDTCECPEGYTATPAGDACVRSDTVDATFSGTVYEVCPGNTSTVYGKFGAEFPGGTHEQNSFWGQTTSPDAIDGRLNEVGVWACNGGSGQAGSNPVGEWIGFSTCLEITEPGDYLVGIAADNRVKFYVDGNLEFIRDSYTTAHFNYWYVQPISLSSGTHFVEMLGYNDGSIASFGAEIYGPFPAGSLVTDADMMAADVENNIVWSTRDLHGDTFDLGEKSGWSCPDGFALNTCDAEPECTELDEVPCDGDASGGGDTGSGDGGDGGQDTGHGDDGDDGTGSTGDDPHG